MDVSGLVLKDKKSSSVGMYSGGSVVASAVFHTQKHTQSYIIEKCHSLKIITDRDKTILHLFVLVLILFYVISTHFLFSVSLKALRYPLNAFVHIAVLLK